MPVSASRRVAGSNASRTPSPHDSASPAWCTSSRITSVLNRSVRIRMRERVDRDAGVGHGDADEVLRGLALAGGVRRVDRDAGPRGGLGPLELEVLGRRDDGDPVDDPAAEQLGGDRQRERRLAGARRRDGEEVARLRARSTARSAAVCQARSERAVPQAARSGQAGESAGQVGGVVAVRVTPGSPLRRRRRASSTPRSPCTPGRPGTSPGARLGTQTLPQSATTGVPITIASVSLSLST